MFLSLRVGVFIRVVVVAAAVAATLMLLLTAQSSPSTGPVDARDTDGKPQAVQATGQPAEVRYYVDGTDGQGLNVRTCPSVKCTKAGQLGEGELYAAACWKTGSPVGGSTRWLAGNVDGREVFAAAHYLRQVNDIAVGPCDRPEMKSHDLA